jgi:hypothetical protein
MGKLTKSAASLESAANLAESRAIKRSHKARHGADADADALALERRLLENMWRELAATEKFFRDAVHPRSTLHSFAMCPGMLTRSSVPDFRAWLPQVQRRPAEIAAGGNALGGEIRARFIGAPALHPQAPRVCFLRSVAMTPSPPRTLLHECPAVVAMLNVAPLSELKRERGRAWEPEQGGEASGPAVAPGPPSGGCPRL